MAVGDGELNNRFSYHPASGDTAPRYAEVRQAFLELAKFVDDAVPDGRDKALALTELQSAMHWTNSAIAMSTPIADDPERARV